MKTFHKLYHFLGSIQFAILLIAAVALFVITGTFLESHTNSHRYAARFTYGNPIFALLLWCFFINILISTLRRWPFKTQHIPFLITHLGLLMILSGALIKNYAGLQGNMEIMEGSGSHEISFPETYAILLEDNEGNKNYYSIKSREVVNTPEMKITLREYHPHAEEKMKAWVRGNEAFITGLKPFAVFDAEQLNTLPVSSRAILTPETIWDLIALRSSDAVETAKKAYLQGLQITLKDTKTDSTLYEGHLEDALQSPIEWNEGFAILNLNFSTPSLEIEVHSTKYLKPEKIAISLDGEESLINHNITFPHLGTPITADFQRIPTLAIIQEQDKTFFFAFDPWGRIHSQIYDADSPNSLIVYNQGFGGYAAQAEIPFAPDRKALEKFQFEQIEKQMLAASEMPIPLLPPLQILKDACTDAQTNFIQCCIELLDKNKKSQSWIMPPDTPLSADLSKTLAAIKWNEDKKACQWTYALCEDLEVQIKNGQSFFTALQQKGWPLADQFEAENEEDIDLLMTMLSRQIFGAGSLLPEMPHDPSHNGSLLSAYFRTYGIHIDHIPYESMPAENFKLESPITTDYKSAAPFLKLEENRPKITLEIDDGTKRELVSLLYDRSGAGLKQPTSDGRFLLRFQPTVQEIPYHIRLHQARQINYPGTNQPYSYESDLTITDRRSGQSEEKTISMNNVHETWEGHRFYMANIAPTETEVKRIHIVVNHDPAKYWLTYPGALLVSLGILLLFWLRPYKTR